MADQADFPDIYIDSSVEAGGVGSEADPYSAFSEINWTTGGDNSIFDYYASGPAASVTINLKKGETWYERFTFAANGVASYYIKLQSYGSGADPIIDGSVDLTSATYKWTESTTTPGEFFCELATGGDPGLENSSVFFVDDVNMVRGGVAPDFDAVGSLTNLEFGFGNNDSLGYETFYFRDDSNGDPDGSGVVIRVPQRGCVRIYQSTYTSVDGIHIRYGDEEDWGYRCDGHPVCHHNDILNCTVEWCAGNGISNKSSYSVTDNNTASYCGSHNIEAAGAPTNMLTNVTFSNNVSHHARTTGYLGSSPFDGYGLKFMWVRDSVMYGNHSYANEFDGIDLDGSFGYGCEDCEIYENLVHDNLAAGVLVEIESTRNKIYSNRIYDNSSVSSYDITIFDTANDNEIYNNIIFKTKDNGRNNVLIGSLYSNEGLKIYGNVLYGGGYSIYCIYAENGPVAKNMKIFNNIMSGCGSGNKPLYIDTCTDYTGFDENNNVYLAYGGVGSDIIHYDGVNYNLTEWQAAGFGADSKDADPLYTDQDNQDFTLQAGSPCLDEGTPLGPPYNIGLLPGSTWPDGVLTGDRGDY